MSNCMVNGPNNGAIANGDHAAANIKNKLEKQIWKKETFEAGETVELRSGGVLMTIKEINDSGTEAVCGWFKGKELFEQSFPIYMITHKYPSWRNGADV